MTNQTLKNLENNPAPENSQPPAEAGLSLEFIEKISVEQGTILNSLKTRISLKKYFLLEERIAAQKKEFEKLLEWQTGKKMTASRYTLILDPAVFEQKFL